MTTNCAAFPLLTDEELTCLRSIAKSRTYSDGEVVFRAGQAEIDFHVIESGELDIVNPADDGKLIVTHGAQHFAGDIDLLTGRPVIVTAIARGKTQVLSLPNSKLRLLLNKIPSLGEKLITAFTARRELLNQTGKLGLRVFGPPHCRDTTVVREFLYKNFVPFTWAEELTEPLRQQIVDSGRKVRTPAIECNNGELLVEPSLRELAKAAGIWRHCPTQEVDLAIVGAGPAGITTAVYAASEGLSTLVLDRLGPGGQAGGSSRIENFIGFPAGLTGTELATRGVLQMLKFGAQIVAPVNVDKLVPASASEEFHTLHVDCGAKIRARVVLVATGVHWRKLEAKNADRFERAGVFYACTSVEALLYDQEDVAVVGAGNSAGQAAMYLAECCRTRTVHMVIRRELGPAMSSYLANRIRASSNIVVHEHAEITAVNGDARPESVDVKSADGKEQCHLPCRAVFVFIGSEPLADWLPPEIARDELGFLLTGTDVLCSDLWKVLDRDPCPLETNLPGILAAGDIRSGSTKRVGFAVGDGSMAVTCVHKLLSIRT